MEVDLYHKAYIHKEPPAMDGALGSSVISILRFAPLFLLFNGYWIIDNKQFFDNLSIYKDKSTDY